jgi:hypothetical protein
MVEQSLEWTEGHWTAWRDAQDEAVIHSSAPGLKFVSRCGVPVDVPLGTPSKTAAGVGVVVLFSEILERSLRYPGDTIERTVCSRCRAAPAH